MKVPQIVAFCLALAAAACVSTGFYPALVVLPASDVHATAEWYVRNAGFTLKSEQAGRALLEREQFQLALEKNDGCFVKLTFHVKDIDDVAAHLRANGVKFQTEPHDDLTEGTRAFTVLDNEGNWIEFIGGLPGPSVPGAAKMSL